MPTESEILDAIEQLNNEVDSIIDDVLIVAVILYILRYQQRVSSADFITENGRFLPNRRNYSELNKIENDMQLEFLKFSTSYFKVYDRVAKLSVDFTKKMGADHNFSAKDSKAVETIRKLDFDAWFGKGRELDMLIKRQLTAAIATGASLKSSIENLKALLLSSQGLSPLSKYADTYMRMAVISLGNAVDKEIYDTMGGAGPDAMYLYAGPRDKKNRSFCASRVNGEFSLDQIAKFPDENGSGLNPFYVAPGGWNCRHKLIFVTGDK
jgi:hypothetical protein